MQFTFGIITNGSQDLSAIIRSIIGLNISEKMFEIIIVGGTNTYTDINRNIKHIPFNETIKPNWITKKKNIVIQEAIFENVAILHDYISFDKDWYSSFITFGNNWDVCTCYIKNNNGKRFREFCFFPGYEWYKDISEKIEGKCLLPFNTEVTHNMLKYMYINGTFLICKKKIGLNIPFNEELVWGQGEDVEWYCNVISSYRDIKINWMSILYLNKDKTQCIWEEECKKEHINLLFKNDS